MTKLLNSLVFFLTTSIITALAYIPFYSLQFLYNELVEKKASILTLELFLIGLFANIVVGLLITLGCRLLKNSYDWSNKKVHHYYETPWKAFIFYLLFIGFFIAVTLIFISIYP